MLNEAPDTAFKLLVRCAQQSNVFLSQNQWENLLEHLDSHWVHSVEDLRLALLGGYSEILLSSLPESLVKSVSILLGIDKLEVKAVEGEQEEGEDALDLIIGDQVANYHHDFDDNGIISRLSTEDDSKQMNSPVDLNKLIVTSSQLETDSSLPSMLFSNSPGTLITANLPSSWVQFIFCDVIIRPTCYTLRHSVNHADNFLRSWTLTASNDGKNWVLLRQHNDDKFIHQKGQSYTWLIHSDQKFHMFKITITGPNSSNRNQILLSGFEIYGAFSKSTDYHVGKMISPSAPSAYFRKQYKYSHDFDLNGVIHALGSKDEKSVWRNPVELGQLIVRASSLSKTSKPSKFLVGKETVRLNTRNTRNSWFSVELLYCKVMPTHYSLRHYASFDAEVLRNWSFQGSQDGQTWETLITHKNDTSLQETRGSTHTWEIVPAPTQYFSHFRILQTDKNSSGRYYLALSGLELYGNVEASIDSGLSPNASLPEISTETDTLPLLKDINWDKVCRSPNLINRDVMIIENRGSNNSWQTCRITQQFSSGICEASFLFRKSTSTTNSWKAIVGLVPQNFFPQGKVQWIGSQKSWGYVSATGNCCYNTAKAVRYGASFDEGDVITISADYSSGHISFLKNGISQGKAFSNLRDEPAVYPAVSLTGTGSQFQLIELKCQDGFYNFKKVIPQTLPTTASSWDNQCKTSGIAFNGSASAINTADSNRWQMVRTEKSWDVGKEELDFEVKILDGKPTKNKWRFLVGVCPTNYEIKSQAPVWMDQGCVGYIAGSGQLFVDNIREPVKYGSGFGQGDIVRVRVRNGMIEFELNGVSQGIQEAGNVLKGLMHGAVCMTAEGARVDLILSKK